MTFYLGDYTMALTNVKSNRRKIGKGQTVELAKVKNYKPSRLTQLPSQLGIGLVGDGILNTLFIPFTQSTYSGYKPGDYLIMLSMSIGAGLLGAGLLKFGSVLEKNEIKKKYSIDTRNVKKNDIIFKYIEVKNVKQDKDFIYLTTKVLKGKRKDSVIQIKIDRNDGKFRRVELIKWGLINVVYNPSFLPGDISAVGIDIVAGTGAAILPLLL